MYCFIIYTIGDGSGAAGASVAPGYILSLIKTYHANVLSEENDGEFIIP